MKQLSKCGQISKPVQQAPGRRNVPSKMTSTRFNQPWINTDVKRLSRRKKRSFVRARNSGNIKDRERYHVLKKQSRVACKRALNEYLTDIISPQSTSNPKRFWQYINSKRCDASGVAALKSPSGSLQLDSMQKANVLNQQFSSVFNSNEDISTIPYKDRSPYPSMGNISVSPAGVFKLLSELDPHKATGPDEIPTRLLKELAQELTPILTIFLQASLNQGKIPLDWKAANISPVFKSGDRHDPSNYRPISLTSVTCKMLEHIIHSNIMDHLDIHTILSDVQHGFRKKRSCTSQLTLAIHDLAKGIDNREQIDVILLDFSKAFDKVPHSRLLYKLDYYGIRGTLHNWLSDFLHNRTQRVILEGSISSSVNVASGVPQGSVIGPLLFLLFINDLPECLSTDCTVRLFADDCMIYKTIKSEADARILQQNLDALQCWETDWLMQFNPNKCKVLHLTNKRKPLLNSYNIHGQPLANTNTAKYLGIHIQNNLSWNHHINQVAKKANSTSAFLQRNIHACPRKIKVLCYLTLLPDQSWSMPA